MRTRTNRLVALVRTRTTVARALALAGLVISLAACGEFEVRSVVIDLRVLAIQAEPPEVVVPITLEQLPATLEDPVALQEIINNLPDVEVCALVADPNDTRSLEYRMRACRPTDTLRCDEDGISIIDMAAGVIDDPEEAAAPVRACGTLSPSFELLSVLGESLQEDPLAGFAGIEVLIEFSVRPAGAPMEDAVYAGKRAIYSLDHPPGKRANQNPVIDELVQELADGQESPLPLGRCGEVDAPVIDIGTGTGDADATVVFVPKESADAREEYTVATFDGGTRSFTENLTYSWYTSAGKWQRDTTGGPRDIAGNDAPLDTEWTPPDDLETATDVRFWVIQRDERGGSSWYHSCVRVLP